MLYKTGDERLFEKDSEEYNKIRKFCEVLNRRSPNNKTYIVKDVYLDLGLDWKWTTVVTENCQILSNRMWLEILNGEDLEDIADEYFSGDFCQDK